MKCPCGANLAQISATGEPMLRARGFVLKAASLHAICPKCKGDVPVAGEMAKALSLRLSGPVPAAPQRPILFLKSHVKGHTRTLGSGKVVQVRDYDNTTLPHSPTDPAERMRLMAERGKGHIHHDSPAGRQELGPWDEGNPRILAAKVGKAPEQWGQAPEGATDATSFNYGAGPVTVWSKRTRNGEMTWDPDEAEGGGWNARTEPHHVAWRMHQARSSAEK